MSPHETGRKGTLFWSALKCEPDGPQEAFETALGPGFESVAYVAGSTLATAVSFVTKVPSGKSRSVCSRSPASSVSASIPSPFLVIFRAGLLLGSGVWFVAKVC